MSYTDEGEQYYILYTANHDCIVFPAAGSFCPRALLGALDKQIVNFPLGISSSTLPKNEPPTEIVTGEQIRKSMNNYVALGRYMVES